MTKTQTNIFPNYKSRPEVLRYLQSDDRLWDCFTRMPKASRELLIGFFLGQNGLPVTYDTVFQKIFDPETHPDRLEALLSALFGRKVKIIEILPREGTQLTEKGSEYSGVIYTANPDVETADSGKSETDIPA